MDAGTAVARAGGCVAGTGRRHLSEPAHSPRRRLRRRRTDRYSGALHRRQAWHGAGPTCRRREQAGRGRHRGDARCAGAAARRLYAPPVHAFRRHQHGGLSQCRLSARRHRADFAHRQILLRPGAGQRRPGGRLQILRRLRQGASGRSHLRNGRRRLGAGNRDAPDRQADRHRAQPDSVPRRRRRGAGAGRRQGRPLSVADARHHVAISGQAAQNHRHHQSRAPERHARGADAQGAGF